MYEIIRRKESTNNYIILAKRRPQVFVFLLFLLEKRLKIMNGVFLFIFMKS